MVYDSNHISSDSPSTLEICHPSLYVAFHVNEASMKIRQTPATSLARVSMDSYVLGSPFDAIAYTRKRKQLDLM